MTKNNKQQVADLPRGNTASATLPQDRFINRELSWLKFNKRVLEEAENEHTPLLERIRFLSISASNLDEFYMVRVAGLIGQAASRIHDKSNDGMTPEQQLDAIRRDVEALFASQDACLTDLLEQCCDAGITVVKEDALDDLSRAWLSSFFNDQIFPVLTPLAVDLFHPFPFIQNGSLLFALRLNRPEDDRELNGIILMPPQLDRFVRLPGPETRFIALEDVIALHLDRLFPGFGIHHHGLFRIIRDSEVEIDEEAEDLVQTYETMLKRRRRGHVIRIEVAANVPETFQKFIIEQFDVRFTHILIVEGMLGLTDIHNIVAEDREDLLYAPMQPRYPERVRENGGDIMATIRAKDFVVHHPYESFDVVVEFLHQAAQDPLVVSIKHTMYRTTENSPIIEALIEAAESGKLVTALIELKARFDEEINIRHARELERAGVQVVYGFFDLKTHAKTSLVVRREGTELRTYIHFGTGNYHPVNAKVYTDLSFFSSDQALGRDATALFNYITGYATPKDMEKLIYAPVTLRPRLLELIDDEIALARSDKPAGIWAKMNALVDTEIIDALYRASQAGVKIELFVRGICCLRPGIEGLSENIRVKSIVGRFLEHSRIICFGNGHALPSEKCRVFLSSADWMPRNLRRRIETLVPIETQTIKQQLIEQIMLANRSDRAQSWNMQPDGTYTRIAEEPGDFSAHVYFMTNPSLSGRGSAIETSRPSTPTARRSV